MNVTGMTCAHCVHAVSGELGELPGVTAVDVELRPGGVSAVRVTSDAPLDPRAVARAVDEAGYEVAPGD